MTYTTLYLGLRTVIEGGVLTAGNTSQVSDVALACVLMDGALAAKQNVTPLGIYTSISVTVASQMKWELLQNSQRQNY